MSRKGSWRTCQMSNGGVGVGGGGAFGRGMSQETRGKDAVGESLGDHLTVPNPPGKNKISKY